MNSLGKRHVEEGGGTAKRRREMGEARRVAEIVMVLSAMGRMRGGRDPTEAEKAMMAEARTRVVALCQEVGPGELLPKDSFGVLIDDLGIATKGKDHRVGFRTPKLSISDRLLITKRRMEESKAFAAQPSLYPSQRLQPGSGAAVENRGTPPSVRVFPADKVSQTPISTGSFQPPGPAVHVSAAASTPLPCHLPSNEVRQPVVSANNVGKDSLSVVPPRSDRAHVRPDGRPSGPFPVPHVPVTSTADRHIVRTTPVHLQPQLQPPPPPQPQPQPIQINVGAKSKVPDQFPVIARGDSSASSSAPQMTAQPAVAQTLKPAVSQTARVTPPTMNHPVQGVQYVHPPALNHHLEISKVVQRLLNQKLPRPTWTPPSRDYMSRSLPCQFCKIVINDVENMVVCDACEKAFHLGCLQSYNSKNIARGEWICPRCLKMSNGKPYPPKYGRVTRNLNAPKGPGNTVVAQFPSEKKVESVYEKVCLPNAITNENVVVTALSQAVKTNEPSCASNMPPGFDIGRKDMSLRIKKDDEINSGKWPNKSAALVEPCLSTTASSGNKVLKQIVKSEMSSSDDGFISETESSAPVTPPLINKSDDLPVSINQNDVDRKLSVGAESLITNGVVETNQGGDDEKTNSDVSLQNLVKAERVQDHSEELAKALHNGLQNVEWIGNIDRIVDEKKFFLSCRINGVAYQVQDYALFRSGDGKLIPLKLQGMWEDSQTSLKWLVVHKCYFPDDLPAEVGRPGAPQSNEVYESIHDSNVMAGFVQGPCEVLPFRKFGEESERSVQGSQTIDRTKPVFIRNWFYDESKRAFCPSAS